MDLTSRLIVDLAATLKEVAVRIADRRTGSLALFSELKDRGRRRGGVGIPRPFNSDDRDDRSAPIGTIVH